MVCAGLSQFDAGGANIQTLVVLKMDNAIHQIVLLKFIYWRANYVVDSIIQPSNN